MGKKGRDREAAMMGAMQSTPDPNPDQVVINALPAEEPPSLDASTPDVAAVESTLPENTEILSNIIDEGLPLEGQKALTWKDLAFLTAKDKKVIQEEFQESLLPLIPKQTFFGKGNFVIYIDTIKKAPNGELFYKITISSKNEARIIQCLSRDTLEGRLQRGGYAVTKASDSDTVNPIHTKEVAPALEPPVPPVAKVGSFADLGSLLGQPALQEDTKPPANTQEPAASAEAKPEVEQAEEKKESKETVIPDTVYSYESTGKSKKKIFIVVKKITSGRNPKVIYHEYSTHLHKWVTKEPITLKDFRGACEKGTLQKEESSAENIDLNAKLRALGYYKSKRVVFAKENTSEEVYVMGFDDDAQNVSLERISEGKKSWATVSSDEFFKEYKRVEERRSGAAIKPQEQSQLDPLLNQKLELQLADSPVPEPVSDSSPDPDPEEPAPSLGVETEAGRESVAEQLVTLVETHPRFTYHILLDEEARVRHNNGMTKMKAAQLAMMENEDIQALYQKMRTLVTEDFNPKIFTVYQNGALRVWALQRFTEEKETKFLTHIFEIESFPRLPSGDLPEVLQELQKDLSPADAPE